MHWHVLQRKLTQLWKKRLLRAAVALLVIAVAVLFQYWLANRPVPVQVGDAGGIALPPIRAGEQLLIERPDIRSNPLLLHTGNTVEILDVELERATISQETQQDYNLDSRSRLIAGRLSYETQPAQASKVPCSTDVEVQSSDDKSPTEMSFSQSQPPGNEAYRALDVRINHDVVLIVLTNPSDSPADEDSDAEDDGPGCVKRLQGDLLREKEKQKDLAGAVAVKTNVVANSKISLRFYPTDARAPIWSGRDGYLKPFQNVSPILKAARVSLKTSSDSVLFEITAEPNEFVRINTLNIGSDKLEADVSGRGFVKRDGELITLNLFARIQQYPFSAGLLAMANAALLAWLARLVRGLFLSREGLKGTQEN
jgi:hypothetical protein